MLADEKFDQKIQINCWAGILLGPHTRWNRSPYWYDFIAPYEAGFGYAVEQNRGARLQGDMGPPKVNDDRQNMIC